MIVGGTRPGCLNLVGPRQKIGIAPYLPTDIAREAMTGGDGLDRESPNAGTKDLSRESLEARLHCWDKCCDRNTGWLGWRHGTSTSVGKMRRKTPR